jgi:hypothetical protein
MTDETINDLKSRLHALLASARALLRDFLALQARRFLNLETLLATYRIPMYGYAVWMMEPHLAGDDITFRPEMFGWAMLAIAIDRATTPLIDFMIDPVKRQAKRDLAVALEKAALTEAAYQNKRHARPSR